ncbi:MAG: glucose 1-dehydrogenase [Parvularculaceae bacterium]|nr:glucose 1-dehydrogenase [Parvularculaceae bacterium]
MRLTGKVAIITGAGSGIGAACARLFAAEGAKVIASDINLDSVTALAGDIGSSAHGICHDVANEAFWKEVVCEAQSRFGAIDILVNNAGIGRAHKLTQVSLESWRAVMAVNLDGVFLGLKHAIPAMVETGGGSIVNISSIDALMGAPTRAPYCASKGGVAALTKAAAMECCEFGEPVRINSVHPGPVATNIFASSAADSDMAMLAVFGGTVKSVADYYTRNNAMKRFATSEEIAYAALYLASDEASYVTGAQLVVDGGFTAGKLINQKV